MKRTLKYIGITLLILILFRGIIFRLAVKYQEIGTRPKIEISEKHLIDRIEAELLNKIIDTKLVIKIADEITRKELKFTTETASSNPNILMNTQKANCVGYSAMFNSIANYIIGKSNLQNEIVAEHKIGLIELFGINLHEYFDSAFLSDHDFNEITNMATGDKISIDPSLSDYLWIKRVSIKDD